MPECASSTGVVANNVARKRKELFTDRQGGDPIRLFEARDCEGKSLAYWAPEGAGSVEFDASFEAVPRIELTVEINGHPVGALLDSGAFSSVLTKSQAAALGVTPQTAGVVSAGCSTGIGEKSIEFWVGPFAIDPEDGKNEVQRGPMQ